LIWKPDTCDCIIEFNNRGNWIATKQNCKLHHSLRGQNLLNTVIGQNRRFNYAFGIGVEITENQSQIIGISRNVNKLRIRSEPTIDNPNFDEHLPFEQPLSFFQNLRRLLRLNP